MRPQMHTHATVSIESLRAGRVWTALTAAFSHRDLVHLGANMITLYFFGRDVGHLFGGKRVGLHRELLRQGCRLHRANAGCPAPTGGQMQGRFCAVNVTL